MTFPATIPHSTTGTNAYLDSRGIYRWETNDAVVPTDCMEEMKPAGYNMANHERARQAEIDAFLNAYRADPPKRSAEQLAEIRREIGPDAVDIITGRRIFAKVG